MQRLFVGNFSFEQWREPGFNLSRHLLRFESEMASVWLAVATSDDFILCSEKPPESFLCNLGLDQSLTPKFVTSAELAELGIGEVVPWGWTDPVRQLAAKLKIAESSPDQSVVWHVNSREFSTEVSQQLGVDLSGEVIVRSLPGLMPAIQRCHEEFGGWVIKPNFGQAGRGQIRGTTPFLTEDQFGILIHMLSRQQCVAVEPLLCRQHELGFQWEICRETRAVKFIAVTVLLTDDQGRYRGNSQNLAEIPQASIENIRSIQHLAVQRIADAGYWGPVGIDAMLYERDGQLRERPLQDINARWTMGRIAVEWGQKLNDSTGSWIHGPTSSGDDSRPLFAEITGNEPTRFRTWWKKVHSL